MGEHVPEYKTRPPNQLERAEPCTDCGWSYQWWRSELTYCRGCNGKNGYDSEEVVELDVDLLLAWLDFDKQALETLLKACGR